MMENMENTEKKSDKKTTLILILSVLFAATVFSVYAYGEGQPSEPEPMTVEYMEQGINPAEGGEAQGSVADGTVSSGDVTEASARVYPAPDYDFITDEIEVRVEGLEQEYRIAFVNDLHLITDHESGDITEDALYTVNSRYENLAVTEEGIHAEELWPEVVKYLNYHDFDAVILGGDLLDYCSNSNIMALNAGIRELKYPAERMMYLRSDHDYGGWYGGIGFQDEDGFRLQTLVLDGDRQEKCIEFEDFLIVGINQSYRNPSREIYQALHRRLEQGKPVILATHVPFYSEVDDSLAQESMEVRNRIYYWSYTGKTYVPAEEMDKLVQEIYAEDSNVVQIVAAHLHARWDGYVTETIKEHIFAPTFEGKIGIIHVVGE